MKSNLPNDNTRISASVKLGMPMGFGIYFIFIIGGENPKPNQLHLSPSEKLT